MQFREENPAEENPIFKPAGLPHFQIGDDSSNGIAPQRGHRIAALLPKQSASIGCPLVPVTAAFVIVAI